MRLTNGLMNELNKKGYRVLVNHLHNHSDPNSIRRTQVLTKEFSFPANNGRQYVTVARLVNKKGDTLLTANAICAPNDQPDRKRGYQIAVGRLVRSIYDSGLV